MKLNSYTVTVIIKNFGTVGVTSIPVAFRIGYSPQKDEICYDYILPDSSSEFTFSSKYTVTSISSSASWAKTQLNLDDSTDNDTYHLTYYYGTPPVNVDDINKGYINSPFQISKVYPNPSPDQMTFEVINSNAQMENVTFRTVTVEGKLVNEFSHDLNQGKNAIQLNVSELAPGNYLLVAESDGYKASRKFLKE